MTTAHRNFLARFAVCALLVTTAARPAIAGSIPTKSDAVWIGVGVAERTFLVEKLSKNLGPCRASTATP